MRFVRRIVVHFQTRLGAGLLITLPIGMTILILKFFFDLLDPLMQDLVLVHLPAPKIPGLGIIILVFLVYLMGLFATRVIGRRFINIGHRIMERIPIVKSIYATTRSGVEILSGNKDHPYRGVVLIDFPREGTKAIGLVTAKLDNVHGQEMLMVYVPTTPVPSSGFLLMVPTDKVMPLEMSVDDAMKIIISGGILAEDLFMRPDTADAAQTGSGG